jgi:hypothetical protein
MRLGDSTAIAAIKSRQGRARSAANCAYCAGSQLGILSPNVFLDYCFAAS